MWWWVLRAVSEWSVSEHNLLFLMLKTMSGGWYQCGRFTPVEAWPSRHNISSRSPNRRLRVAQAGCGINHPAGESDRGVAGSITQRITGPRNTCLSNCRCIRTRTLRRSLGRRCTSSVSSCPRPARSRARRTCARSAVTYSCINRCTRPRRPTPSSCAAPVVASRM